MPTGSIVSRWLVPKGVAPEATPPLRARALRAFVDGYVAVLLPAYLLAIGLGTLQVGIVSTVAMLGSALAPLGVGPKGIASRPTCLGRCSRPDGGHWAVLCASRGNISSRNTRQVLEGSVRYCGRTRVIPLHDRLPLSCTAVIGFRQDWRYLPAFAG